MVGPNGVGEFGYDVNDFGVVGDKEDHASFLLKKMMQCGICNCHAIMCACASSKLVDNDQRAVGAVPEYIGSLTEFL